MADDDKVAAGQGRRQLVLDSYGRPSKVPETGELEVDLALAHSVGGDRDAARTYVQQARRIISQVGSVRLRRRLERLVLPGDSRSA